MKALKLAKQYRKTMPPDMMHLWATDSVREMERLAEVNADLLEELVAARKTIADFQAALTGAFFQEQIDSMDYAIAKAKEQQ